MATSDERREVAENLRKAKVECDERDYPWMVEDLLQALGFERYEDGEDGIFDRLADLIDPTCSMEVLDTGEQVDYECAEHIMHCKSCGAEFGYVLYSEDGDVDMGVAPNYCPDCGARLVSE
mgnify:CR=1 FL=1